MAKAAFGASILLTAVLALAQRPDEVPMADLLEVLVLDRQLVAIDARGGGQKATPLAEAAEAHRRIESRLAFGRVLLIP